MSNEITMAALRDLAARINDIAKLSGLTFTIDPKKVADYDKKDSSNV